MKFTLIYDGPLPAGASKRAEYAAKIRNFLHPQLRDLWENHVLLRQLKHVARGTTHNLGDLGVVFQPAVLSDFSDEPPPLREDQVDLTAPLEVGSFKFRPIVRRSLYLACGIDILFLRHEEPGQLFELSGDMDNRLKCFFDGLKVPDSAQLQAGESPRSDPLCCLLDDDRYISDFSVRSGRLLGGDDKHQFDVRIQADITVKVLRVFHANMCLVGG